MAEQKKQKKFYYILMIKRTAFGPFFFFAYKLYHLSVLYCYN